VKIVGLTEVIAIVRPDNQPSIRVIEKLGMTLKKEIIYKGEPGLFYILSKPNNLF
jgi:RimJ/RimL family protein N-acetyltransferase